MEFWTQTLAIGWDHVTPANILFTIMSISTAVSSLATLVQSKRNAKIATETSAKIDENTATTAKVEKNVNGHLTALTQELVETKAKLAAASTIVTL